MGRRSALLAGLVAVALAAIAAWRWGAALTLSLGLAAPAADSWIWTDTGREAVEAARQLQPRVILLDIHLPDMDGYEVAAALRGDPATRDIPIVAVSADAMPTDVERGRAAGFASYVTKPIDLDGLRLTLGRIAS